MFKMYNTDLITNITEEVTEYKRGNWINMIAPSDDEIKTVCENINIQEDFIRYALDPEERARIDYEEDDGTTLILADVPIIEKDEDQKEYSTIPVGFIIVRDEYFITVSLMENQVIRRMNPMKNKSVATYKKSRLVLQCLYVNSEIYLNLLKKINRETDGLPTVEDNLRNIAKIVEEEKDQLKIIEERTGEFKLDFSGDEEKKKDSLIDEIDDDMSLDELMSLYEKKFKD